MSIETIIDKDNFTAINVGKFADINKYEVKDETGKILFTEKVFLKEPAKITGAQISYTVYQPGKTGPFFHHHKENEEVYLIISGSGEFQVDETVFPIKEGSVIRVGPQGSHDLKNTGTVPLVFVCVQTKENSLSPDLRSDGVIVQTPPKFTV